MFKSRTYFELTAQELNQLIDDQFGRHYNVYQVEGVTYGTVLYFDVSDRMTRFEQTDVANFRGLNFVPNVTRALLTSLAEKELIPVGRYIIVSAM
jgi:hypothetical protein